MQLIFDQHEVRPSVLKSFDVNSGEKILINGPSGCGKTSLLESIYGLRKYTAQEFSIDPNSCFIFQDLNLIEDFSIRENLSLELKNDQIPIAEKLIEKFELKIKDNRIIKTLSRGEQQRISVARSLAKNTELILADEPTSHLDKRRAHLVMETLVQKSNTLIVVSHDIAMEKYFKRVIKLEEELI